MSASGPSPLNRDTLTVHHGYDPAGSQGAAKPPIYLTSTFVYRSAQHAKDIHERFFDTPEGGLPGYGAGEADPAFIYARLGHPNLLMLEARLAALDGADEAAVFSSGMAALSTALLANLKPGDTVLYSQPIYSGTYGVLNTLLPSYGVTPFGFLDGLDEAVVTAQAQAAMAKGPLGVIMVESPANPTAAVVDIAMIVRVADAVERRQVRRPIVVVDNTFLGPFLQSPLADGADLCLTSLTKYCAGHSDLLAGGASGRAEVVRPLKAFRTLVGNHLDPYTSWLVMRSFETLHIRTERACANALAVASFLRDHPKVVGLTYLGFTPEGSAGRALLDRQTRGTGSTFSFRIAGGEAEAFRMLDRLKLLRLAVSLGGSETLICHPATTTHYAVPRDQREAFGIDDATLRLSVGIEHPDDLIADLAQALEAV